LASEFVVVAAAAWLGRPGCGRLGAVFTPIFALQRRGLMQRAAEQLQCTIRDEVLHCAFGIRVVRELLKED